MSKNRTLADFISTSSVSAEEIANGAVTVVKLANTTSSNGTSFIQMSGHSTALNITPSGRIGINTSDPLVPLHIENEGMRIARNSGDAYIQLTQQGSTDVSLYGGTNGFRVFNSSSESLRIDSSGKVGIGTTSPGAKLEVKGPWESNHGQLVINNNGSNVYGGLTLHYTNTIKGFLYHENSLNLVSLIGAASQGLSFHTDSTTGTNNERMRIHSGGQVSIASTEATHGLNVGQSGTDFRGRFQGNNPYRLGLQNGTNNLVWLGSPGADAFRISNAAGSAVFDIDGSGNVGIGTTSPSNKLHVETAGTNYITSRDSTSGGIAGVILQNGSDTRGIRINGSNLELYDHSAGSARVVVNSSGNVGIGTTSPNRSLEVTDGTSGKIRVSGTSGGFLECWDGTYGVYFGSAAATLGSGPSQDGIIWTEGGGVQRFYTSGVERMRIDSTGRVGIGTTFPAQELDLAGQILIQPTGVTSGTTDTARKLSFRGVGSTWSEYVEDFVQTQNNQQTSGTTSHWFAIKSYSRYQAASSQGGMMNVKIIKNADHATMCHYYEYMLFQGTGSGGGNTSTSTTLVQLWDVAAKTLGWNYYSLTVTPTFYYPNSGLTITNYYEERYPLLLKVEVSGNSNYNREIGVAVSGYVGRLYRLSGEALEYLGSSTPADFTGNYSTLSSSGAWL